MKFKNEDIIEFGNGEKIRVIQPLGSGGQGEVYLVEYEGKQWAFKYYKDPVSQNFAHNLKKNIANGSPSSQFLWPQKLVDFGEGNLGYLMDLRPSNFESFVHFVNAKFQFKDTATLIKWCINLCLGFKKLHEKGYSYQDLNEGSFFMDKDTGDILICDNDNVTADKQNLGIIGKIKYMAPEVVLRKHDPDIHTDRFSLAVILFMALCKGDPLEGECLKNYDFSDEKSQKEMYGTNPIFVYHKTDKSNRPIRGYHVSVIALWPTLPLYIKEAFHKTFVDGVADRENSRTTEVEWIKHLCTYRDELITCQKCGREFIYGFAEKKPNEACPYCGAAKRNANILSIGKHKIVVELGKNIYMHHIDKYSSEYITPVGKIIANKNNPSLWGIKLNLGRSVQIKDTFGKEKVIAGDGVIPIIKDLTIQFDEKTKGEVK